MEVEFVAQILQLVAGTKDARNPCTRRALALLKKGGLLNAAETKLLLEADTVWRQLQCLLRLLCGPVPPVDLERGLAPGAVKILLRVMGDATLPDLMARTAHLAQAVRQIFEQRVGAVGVEDSFAPKAPEERSVSSAV